jgi:hypothetical protein
MVSREFMREAAEKALKEAVEVAWDDVTPEHEITSAIFKQFCPLNKCYYDYDVDEEDEEECPEICDLFLYEEFMDVIEKALKEALKIELDAEKAVEALATHLKKYGIEV